MKKHLISFIHQPKKVAVVSLIIAVVIGVIGYVNINKKPNNQTENNNVPVVEDMSLNFFSSGTVETVLVKVGDQVKKGQVLATLNANNMDGSLIQAKAVYQMAKANYQKIINGATSATIDLAKAAVNTATVNLQEITKQQEVAVNNAYRTLLNSSIEVKNVSTTNTYDVPTITGTYGCPNEGTYNLNTYGSADGVHLSYSGLEEGSLLLNEISRPLGKCGLFVSFDRAKTLQAGIDFYIQIPNKNASNYNANNNAYQLALQNKEQAVNLAQATLDQAKASLEAVVTNARPEDVAVAKAQVENAYGALISNPSYRNTTITAPGDGTIIAVYITSGQVFTTNSKAIEFVGLTN